MSTDNIPSIVKNYMEKLDFKIINDFLVSMLSSLWLHNAQFSYVTYVYAYILLMQTEFDGIILSLYYYIMVKVYLQKEFIS